MLPPQKSSQTTFFIISLTLMTVSLAAAFFTPGQWPGIVVAIGIAALWFYFRKRNNRWLLHGFLLAALTLAAAATTNGGLPVPAIIGAGFAVMTWDLHQLTLDLRDSPLKESTRRFERQHLQTMGLALAAGITIALVGRMLSLKPPFILIVVMVLLVLFGLYRMWSVFTKTR